MRTFEVLRPVRINTKTLGNLSLKFGERVTWPDAAVQQLLEKIPEKIRVIMEGTDLQKLEPSGAVSSTQTAFDLNSGCNPTAPPVRHALYEVGAIVSIRSPLFGRFKAEVLRDNGGVVWVLHPFIQREVAIPNEWLIAEGGTRSDCARGLDHQQ